MFQFRYWSLFFLNTIIAVKLGNLCVRQHLKFMLCYFSSIFWFNGGIIFAVTAFWGVIVWELTAYHSAPRAGRAHATHVISHWQRSDSGHSRRAYTYNLLAQITANAGNALQCFPRILGTYIQWLVFFMKQCKLPYGYFPSVLQTCEGFICNNVALCFATNKFVCIDVGGSATNHC
jgi:hypothetical protein